MLDWKWSDAAKSLARRVYEEARLAESDDALADCKARLAALTSIDEIWAHEVYLQRRRAELNEKYDYRDSRLAWLFAQLVREGRVQPEQLQGLSAQRVWEILRVASL